MNQEVRCLTVAQELGYCQRMDKPFAGTLSFDCSEVDSAPRSQGEHEHGVMVVDVKYALREDPLAGSHRATPTRPRLRRWMLGENLGQSHVRHPRCPSDLAGGSAKGHETSWV